MPRRPDPAGFSLAEVMVALLVLIVGVAGIAAILAHTSRVGRNSIDRSLAREALREKVEEFRAIPYADLRPGTDTIRAGGVDFAREWSVETGVPMDGVKRVSVTVSWTEGVTPAPQTDLEDDGDLLSGGRLRLTTGIARTRSRSAVLYRASY